MRAIDSPWFWLAVFLLGGLLSLALVAPRYTWRQQQLERQYQARERTGYAVPPVAERDSVRSAEPIVSLRPLRWMLVVLLLAASILFWTWKWFSTQPSVPGAPANSVSTSNQRSSLESTTSAPQDADFTPMRNGHDVE